MFPINTAFDKTNCLASLVGIRTACEQGDTVPPFFIEDIEGFDIQKLAKLSLPSAPKGEDLAKWVISSAAREMMGDIELLLSNGFTMRNIVGQQCSTCDLLPVYTANTGITIRSIVVSEYQRLQITDLTILINASGSKTFIIDDGLTTKTFTATFQAGVKMPVKLAYETNQKTVKIYFQDNTIGLGQVRCPTNSSCGCGGRSSVSNSPFVVAGLVAGNENVTQYGFIPCASVGCSYDALVCSMLGQTPNLFGLALLYKVGEKFTIISNQSERNNETASFQDQGGQLVKNFSQLYWAKMKGTGNVKGINTIINQYLKTRKSDKCIVCESKFYTASAIG